MKARAGLYTVSGPGVDERHDTLHVAVTRAQSEALQVGVRRLDRDPSPATYYVRAGGDEAVCRVERNGAGVVTTHVLKVVGR